VACVGPIALGPYRLPLRRPWVSARGRLTDREGWLVSVGCRGGPADIRGYGDCAPLPEAGTEPAGAAWNVLNTLRDSLPGMPIPLALETLASLADAAPAAAYALECALLDLESRLLGLALRRMLARSAGDSVTVNGALGSLPELTSSDLDGAASTGLRVLKIKVGVTDPRREIGRLAELADQLPAGIGLRLDANGAWDLATASWIIATLDGLPVECLEEPLAAPDPQRLARLQTLAGFPLALDESLRALPGILEPGRFPVRRAVLKPAVQGGLRRTLDLALRLQGAGIEVVVTSLVESAAGLWPTAQLAAATGSPIPHGLATADWLAEDLGDPPRPQGQTLQLPTLPGSGFVPYAKWLR
jgi:o-succinylbenzoate synthase